MDVAYNAGAASYPIRSPECGSCGQRHRPRRRRSRRQQPRHCSWSRNRCRLLASPQSIHCSNRPSRKRRRHNSTDHRRSRGYRRAGRTGPRSRSCLRGNERSGHRRRCSIGSPHRHRRSRFHPMRSRYRPRTRESDRNTPQNSSYPVGRLHLGLGCRCSTRSWSRHRRSRYTRSGRVWTHRMRPPAPPVRHTPADRPPLYCQPRRQRVP